MIDPGLTPPVADAFSSFGGAIDFIFSSRIGPGGVEVGGTAQVLDLLWTQVWISVLALAVSVGFVVSVSRGASPAASARRVSVTSRQRS